MDYYPEYWCYPGVLISLMIWVKIYGREYPMFTQSYKSIMRGFTQTISKLEARAVRNSKKIARKEAVIKHMETKRNEFDKELQLCMKMAEKMTKFLEV